MNQPIIKLLLTGPPGCGKTTENAKLVYRLRYGNVVAAVLLKSSNAAIPSRHLHYVLPGLIAIVLFSRLSWRRR